MIAGLFDHLWQSTIFAAAAGLLTLTLARNGAHVRYGLWLAASVKFLVPFSLLVALGARLAPQADASAVSSFAILAQQAAQPFALATPVLANAAPALDLRPALWALWTVGFLTVASIRVARWSRIATALSGAQPVATTSPIPIMSSPTRLEPGLVGLWRPVLLMPEGVADELTAEEMSAVVAHELCHLRRRDNLTAAIHMIVECLFWFYPPVWWIGSRLIDERERACDEGVVASGAAPQVYAEGILKVCKFYLQSPLACAAGVSGSNLSNRMESIMSQKVIAPLSASKRLLLAGFALTALMAPVAAGAAAASAPARDEAASVPTEDEIAQRRYDQARPRTAVAFDPARFDRYVGFYQLGTATIFTVTRRGDRFFAELTGQPAVEVFPESDSKFFYKVVPAQISFLSGPDGSVQALVLHQNGFEQRAARIDERTAKAVGDALAQRIKDNRPSPGTEQALRGLFAALQAGTPNYGDMTPTVAAATRAQLSVLKDGMAKWGPVKSIAFKRVGPGGNDQYDVVFQNEAQVWVIGLNTDGKVAAVGRLPGG